MNFYSQKKSCPSFTINVKIDSQNKSSNILQNLDTKNRENFDTQNPIKKISANSIMSFLENSCRINKPILSFKGYQGDPQPTKKLFWILTGRNEIYTDNYTNERLFNNGQTGWKKWLSVRPNEALSRSPEQAIQSICTLQNKNYLPEFIPTPNYGDKWGRHANYIEINPRLIAKHENGEVSEGLLNAIKLLPIIPPSPNSSANCLILSQLYPCFYKDAEGTNGFGSLYTVDLHSGISKNLTSRGLTRNSQRMGDDELVKAFNDFAHMRGFKTGFRMPLSAGQMTLHGRLFDWQKDESAFIDACCWGIELGFDSIYFDSAKHVGFYDMGNYCGNGNLPTFDQIQRILYLIRNKTKRNDLAFIGEKCTPDDRFRQMGLNVGTDWGNAYNKDSVKYESNNAKHSRDYASGPEISNDNDYGHMSYQQRRDRLENCIFGYHNIADKLPIFMQMTDIFPISPCTNTHDSMMHSKSFSAFGDAQSHYNNVFNQSDSAFNHQNSVYNIFQKAMYL